MDHRGELGSHPWVNVFSWASLVPVIDFVALFWILPISLQIVLWESAAQDFQRSTWNPVPAAPTLSWSPSHQILVKGEYIELKCSPPGQKGEKYFFDRMNEKGDWKRYQEQIGNTLLIPALRMAPKATFSCSYKGKNREGRKSQSLKSNWGKFSVIEPPPAPSLSPDPPEPLYLVGENITLWCSTPNLPLQGRRRYEFSHTRQNESEPSIKDLDWHEGNISLVLTATREDSGLYKCRYLEWNYEREIPSEWSRPVSIVVREPPPAPILSPDPPEPLYLVGENITLWCSTPNLLLQGRRRYAFSHTRQNESEPSIKDLHWQEGNISLILTAAREDSGLYKCRYLEWNYEREIPSEWSRPVSIVVREPPPAPILSPDPPEPLYLVGENITLWCSTPNLLLQGRRRYAFSHTRQNESEPSIKDLHWHEGNISLILTAAREDSGLYKCRYLEWNYEREIPSEWSRPVSIVVRDPLPPPVLELQPSGSLEILSILCLSSESNNPKRFHFSQDGVEMASSNEEPVKSSRDSGLLTLNMSAALLCAKDNKSLQFACRYEENINGRWIMSPWSQTLNTTVASALFAPSMVYALLLLLVPFLGAPLLFCWCRRKNASGCQRRSDPKKGKEETRLNDLGSENLEMEDLEDSELTYALVRTSSTAIPLAPRTKNRPKTREEYQVMYSEVRVHATSRTDP